MKHELQPQPLGIFLSSLLISQIDWVKIKTELLLLQNYMIMEYSKMIMYILVKFKGKKQNTEEVMLEWILKDTVCVN